MADSIIPNILKIKQEAFKIRNVVLIFEFYYSSGQFEESSELDSTSRKNV